MARDLHTLYDMLQKAKELVADNQLTQAKTVLLRMKSFLEDAEIDGAPYDMVMGIMDECEDLLDKYFPGELDEDVAIPPKSFWQKIWRK